MRKQKSMGNRYADQLSRFQSLPLAQKIALTERRISEFHLKLRGKVYIAFSGGKDSTVLLHIARKLFHDIKAVFCDTGLEYPEIRDFVKTFNNVDWLKPNMSFKEVIETHGYPVISKDVSQKVKEIRNTNSEKLKNIRLYGDEKGNGKLPDKWKFLIDEAPFKISDRCCHILKKNPAKIYERKTGLQPILGNMAIESRLRKMQYIKSGCNSYGSRSTSTPIIFWTEKDIYGYINKENLKISEIYNKGEVRTGCMYCMFGVQFDNQDGLERFERMKVHHPKIYRYCMENLGCKEVIDFIVNSGVINGKAKV